MLKLAYLASVATAGIHGCCSFCTRHTVGHLGTFTHKLLPSVAAPSTAYTLLSSVATQRLHTAAECGCRAGAVDLLVHYQPHLGQVTRLEAEGAAVVAG